MRTLLLIVPALLIIGCSDSDKKTAIEANKTIITIEKTPAQAKVINDIAVQPAGQVLFAQRCSSCHGSNAEKKAMNVSQIIAGWDKEQTLKVFQGYQNGTYGGKMKSIMKSQASLLSPEQKEAIADFLLTLKR